jgi:hypothetical protein
MTGNYPVGLRNADGVARLDTVLCPFEEFAKRLRSRPESLPEVPPAPGG